MLWEPRSWSMASPSRRPRPPSSPCPPGKYNLSVLKDGHRADQEIEIKDGSLLKFTLQLNP